MKEKTLLIELYPYHIELIYSQVAFLKESGIPFTFITDQRNSGKIDFMNDERVIFYDFKKPLSLWKLWIHVLKEGYSQLIFNTAQGNKMLKFSLFPLPGKISKVGTIHNVNKLKTSTGQKIISRKIKSYFVLASYMKKNFPTKKKLVSEKINYSYLPSDNEVIHLNKPKGIFWLTIPGSIEYKRRDYDFLLVLAQDPSFPENCNFVLLGNALKGEGPGFIQKIKDLGIEKKFVWFEKFVPNSLFNAYMSQTDYLLPLIHPSTPAAYDYLRYKVSGTFLQAKAFSKPMICHDMFNIEDFDFPAVYYQTPGELIQIIKNKNDAPVVEAADFETDRKKYISFIKRKY
ncbi:MAG: hypothetical protein PWQ17_1100 [Anaerophaga sp.]|nr:hypothetical protein [Anaerophaga sp.]